MPRLSVASASHTYTVAIDDCSLAESFERMSENASMLVVDQTVAHLYPEILSRAAVVGAVTLKVNEAAKEWTQVGQLAENLIDAGLRRDHTIVAVGGGITQDVVSFVATVIFRGVAWSFFPTTLLAQADSCIGSKSSINLGNRKNALGSFRAPTEVNIHTSFLRTLSDQEIRSGLGEMLKMSAICGPSQFRALASTYDACRALEPQLQPAIYSALLQKKGVIESDEFDAGPRLVMNYGHTFGHAIEVATNFSMPHGIAVSIGCDLANYVAAEIGVAPRSFFLEMHDYWKRIYSGYGGIRLDFEGYKDALLSDKKHSSQRLCFVLPDKDGVVTVQRFSRKLNVIDMSRNFFDFIRSDQC